MRITIIGAGPGGYDTALAAAKAGAEVVLVEASEVGGTCLNVGCIPTKALCRSAELLENLKQAGELGVSVQDFSLDFPAVMSRKDSVVHQLRTGIEGMLSSAGVNVVRGRAELADAHTVRVQTEAADGTGSSSEGDEQTWYSDYIILATGSSPASLRIPGKDLPGVLDSTGLLNIEKVPERLCIIGAGVIGLEFASVFRSFGSEVTVLEYCREVLPKFESDIAKRLRKSLSNRGINFFMQAEVTGILQAQDTALEVRFNRKGTAESVVADKVLMAVGRRPNNERLGLEAAGVGYSPKGITVDENMRTNVPNIFAIGDVNGRQMLAHAATFQGKVALQAILAEASGISEEASATKSDSLSDKIDLNVMPAAVFTMLEAAGVGLTTDECKEQGIEMKIHKSFYRANGKALCMNESEGLCILIEGPDGRILGCHVLGAHAAELVQEVAALMSAGCGIDRLRSAVHIHPSLSEIVLAASV